MDRKLRSNYRSVISLLWSLFSRILKGKVEQQVTVFNEEQYGFKWDRSCLDNINYLILVIEANGNTTRETPMALIDLGKAYDNVPRSEIFTAM